MCIDGYDIMRFYIAIYEKFGACLGEVGRGKGDRVTFLQLRHKDVKTVDTKNVHQVNEEDILGKPSTSETAIP